MVDKGHMSTPGPERTWTRVSFRKQALQLTLSLQTLSRSHRAVVTPHPAALTGPIPARVLQCQGGKENWGRAF